MSESHGTGKRPANKRPRIDKSGQAPRSDRGRDEGKSSSSKKYDDTSSGKPLRKHSSRGKEQSSSGWSKEPQRRTGSAAPKKSYDTRELLKKSESSKTAKQSRDFDQESPQRDFGHERKKYGPKKSSFGNKPDKRAERSSFSRKPSSDIIRLNKYLADAGVCSRREADQLIAAGVVTVNGVIVTELGTKVSIHDKVVYGGQALRREKLRYVLLNKPKDYITTSDDPYDRKTVMELVKDACGERIYPVGRLDRNTLGLLLLTNDGELAKILTHPKHGVKKLYHVELDKAVAKNDLLRIAAGLELEDGLAEVDEISYVKEADSKKEIGIQLHSGKNRIVRRIFEHLGYKVVKLDRVDYAGLTKYNLPRGKWRHLTPSEVSILKRIK